MLKFEDTNLLRHPTVERAYNVMRTFFQDGDDWAKEAIRAAEIISAKAKNPDPDAIAASILMNGMIVSLDPEQFAETVSPKAAQYLKKFYDLDLDNPKFSSAGEQQVLLAQSMVGLEGVQKQIDSGDIRHIIEFRNVQQILDANERALQAIARSSTEKDMLAAAQTQLAAAQQSLADIVTKRHAEIAFEKTGLPDNPTVRGVYEEMKAWALDGDPLGGYTLTNAAIAKVVVETGASTDPEVISAALLNQYSNFRAGHKKPADFSERIGELYTQTSPWADLGGKKNDTTPKTPEALAITHAALVHFIEGSIKAYPEYLKSPEKYDAAGALERLEDMRDRVEAAAKLQDHPGLKARMEKAVFDANSIMNAPDNVKIRKPGSPKMDRD